MLKFLIPINLFFITLFGYFINYKSENHEITLCNTISGNESNFVLDDNIANSPIELDPNKNYTMPTLSKNTKGEILLTWTEKDAQGVASLCFATSTDGKNFSEKKTVFSGSGLNNSRMMRAKILSKKDGSYVAIFSLRAETVPSQGGRGGRSSNIVYTVSKDGGNTWTTPANVDSDPKQGIVRGFFDAVVLPNDEVAVAYLKDVANSTKHEERDLRMVISKNGEMQPEKLIDPVVCDCCPISLMVDTKGNLNVIYRDNNNDIRDMARMVSADNGVSFSKPEIVHDDKWEIKGCPHSGASSVSVKNEQFYTWFSGTQNGQSGVRLSDSSGKLLKVLDASAKNASLAADDKMAVWVWEQTAESGANSVFYGKVINGKLFDSQIVKNSNNGQNASTLLHNGKVLVAYEILKADKKTVMNVAFVE
ncbi:MAG: glycoside hydrolase [Spirosomaceae bacterium]|jgi:hypothetical protein|nr:glycoside hydrolase [Spirosomataceae bacterium]